MRYCPHCERLSPGKPVICHYCGRSWQVRLCPRGHANPWDANFCGTCGNTDLTETAGALPGWMRFWIWFGIIILALGLIQVLPRLLEALAQELLPVLFLLALVAALFSWLLPQPVAKALGQATLGFLKLIGRLVRFLLFGRETRSRGRGRE